MSVSAQHPEYTDNLPKWKLVRDIVESKDIKSYVRDVDITDPARNNKYKEAAMLVNFTDRTRNGLVGAVFRRDPTIDLPSSIEYMEEDATGSGQTLAKLSKEITGEVLQAGRFGILVDYPASENGLTAAEVDDMNLAARMYKYPAESIINWQTQNVNGNNVLTMVVLKEIIQKVGEDGFTWEAQEQFRVLSLIEGVYTQSLFDEGQDLVNAYEPRNFDGSTWDHIPFVFIGSSDNDTKVDSAPLYDLAVLNVGHLNNSADFEESAHVMGQPTMVIATELSPEEFNSFNPNGFVFGSRHGHILGPNGSAMLLQAAPNQLVDQGMMRKEEQAVMLGARLITKAGINETAEAARIKHSGENSVLSNIADNVEDGIDRALVFVLEFMGSVNEFMDITFELNDQFFDSSLEPQSIMSTIQLLNNNIISKQDVRALLRKHNQIDPLRTDEDIDNDIGTENPLV